MEPQLMEPTNAEIHMIQCEPIGDMFHIKLTKATSIVELFVPSHNLFSFVIDAHKWPGHPGPVYAGMSPCATT
jgi:hypothetical protein